MGLTFRYDYSRVSDEVLKALRDLESKTYPPLPKTALDGWFNYTPIVERVIFNHPATIIFWKDGSKTVVKC